jgi:hypothetical protein
MYIDSTETSYMQLSSVRSTSIRNNSAIASSYAATTGNLTVTKWTPSLRLYPSVLSPVVYLCVQPRAGVSSWRRAQACWLI